MSSRIDIGSDLAPQVEAMLGDFAETRATALSRREHVVEAISAAALLLAVAALALVFPPPRAFEFATAVVLVACYATVMRVRFAVAASYSTPVQLVLVPMLFLLPPAVVPLAVAVAMLICHVPDYVRRRTHPDRVLLAVGDVWHAVGPALVFAIAAVDGPDVGEAPIYAAALAAQFGFDFVSTTLRERYALGIRDAGLQVELFAWVWIVDVLLAPIGFLAVLAAPGAVWPVLLVLPLAGLLALFARERQVRIEHSLELSQAYQGTALLLSDVLEEDDEYTGMHSRDVVSLSAAVAVELGVDDRSRRLVELGALLHDIGKIAVPNEIINKPGKLDADEWAIMKMHTVEGQQMLDRVGGVLRDVGRVVRSSHERWDGTGYPDGLIGEAIPFEATIVSCCDAFNAMTTDRSYRKAMTTQEALDELRRCSGTHFNPAVVDALLRVAERDAVPTPQALVA
jgi:putative nucleotidyltransferase with HDIG domain